MLKRISLLLLTLAWTGVVQAAPISLFEDDFESESAAGSVLNYNTFTNWDVISGTVDLISSGDYSINCAGGGGFCVDSDGSTSDAGRMATTGTFTLTGGNLYTLFVDVSGNQRDSNADQFQFGLTPSGDPSTDLENVTLLSVTGDAYTTQSLGIDLTALGDSFTRENRLFLQGIGTDNVGVVVDNVRFECTRGCDDGTPSVPAPAPLLLLATGLIGLGITLRRQSS